MKLGIHRWEPNVIDPQLAIEFHNKRKKALHDVFDENASIRVIDWGKTDDQQSREYVEISAVVASAVFSYIVLPGLKKLGEKLVDKLVDHATSEGVKYLISKLRPKQENKEIKDYNIRLSNGIWIRVPSPIDDKKISINYSGGATEITIG